MLPHKHLIVSCDIKNKYISVREIEKWINDLAYSLGMKILRPPSSSYCMKVGNKGTTTFCILETSHIALHIWDECSPGQMQLDVYSCSEFTATEVLNELSLFQPLNIKYKFIDRTEDLVEYECR